MIDESPFVGAARTRRAATRTDVDALEIRRESLLLVAEHEPELLVAVITQTGQQLQNLNTALGLYAAALPRSNATTSTPPSSRTSTTRPRI